MTTTKITAKVPSAVILPNQSSQEAIADLAHGCRIIGFSKGQFSMIDLIKSIIEKTGPAHLTLSTWTAGIRDTDNVGFMTEAGDLLSVRLVTDVSIVQRQPRYCETITRVFGADSIRITKMHAKFALLHNESWSIVLRGSMNLNRNPRWEQFEIDDDPVLLAWFQSVVDNIWCSVPAGLRIRTAVAETAFTKQGYLSGLPADEDKPASAIAALCRKIKAGVK